MAATLAEIRKKVRRLTRSPSESQLSNIDLDDYVNNFILYDFPEHLRLFTFKKTLTFYTQPNVDVYDTNTIRLTDPLYDFKNAYITTDVPVYIAGYKAYFTQSRSDFYALYPALQAQYLIGTGNGIITFFSGTLSTKPVLQNAVMFTSYDTNNEGLVLTDIPQIGAITGLPIVLGDLVWPNDVASVGSINYITGDYSFTFPAAPAVRAPIYAQTVGYQAARPQAILYFDNKFIIRPVPDKSYSITIETYVRPTSLGNDGAARPILEQHWQYIAYGAAKKIFEDRMDMESVQLIMPEFKQQELLCLRRTIMQNANERVATIYTQQVGLGSSGWNWSNF